MIYKIIICLLLTFTCFSSEITFKDHYQVIKRSFTGIVISNRVNIRSGKGTSFPIVKKAKVGDEYFVLRNIKDWYEIKLPNIVGYIYGDLVKIKTKNNDGTYKGVSNGNGVNIRKEPSISSKRIGKISKGVRFTVINKEKNWYKIILKIDQTGFIHKKYIIDKENNTVIINKGKICIRSGPTNFHSVVRTTKDSETAILLKNKDNFSKIILNDGKSGWIPSVFIKKISFEKVSDEMFSSVLEFLNESQYEQAIEKAKQIYSQMISSKDKAKAAYYIGFCNMKLDNYAKALEMFRKVSQLDQYSEFIKDSENYITKIQNENLKNVDFYKINSEISSLKAIDINNNGKDDIIIVNFNFKWGDIEIIELSDNKFNKLYSSKDYSEDKGNFIATGDINENGTNEVIIVSNNLSLIENYNNSFHEKNYKITKLFKLKGVLSAINGFICSDLDNNNKSDLLFTVKERTGINNYNKKILFLKSLNSSPEIIDDPDFLLDTPQLRYFIAHKENNKNYILAGYLNEFNEQYISKLIIENSEIKKVSDFNFHNNNYFGTIISIISEDLNSDGNNEIITLDKRDKKTYLTVFKNTGETFIPMKEIAINGNDLVSADIDGNKDKEIIVSSKEGWLYVFHGLGQE